MSSPAVRRATPDDAAAIAALLAAVCREGCLGIAAPPTAEQERRALRAAPPEDFAVWVAEEGARLAGHLLLARGVRPYCAHVADVAVSVAPDARGRGVASALLDAAEHAWAREHGIGKLTAGVLAGNVPALRFFASRGFRREGLRSAQFRIEGVPHDEVVLARFVG